MHHMGRTWQCAVLMMHAVDACHKTGDLQLHRIATFFICVHSVSHTAMCFANVFVFLLS